MNNGALLCVLVVVVVLVVVLLFLFQAEDVIRAATVTGVQTCALPILTSTVKQCTISSGLGLPSGSHVRRTSVPAKNFATCDRSNAPSTSLLSLALELARENSCKSEERRVGKECR